MKIKILVAQIALGLFAHCAYANNTVTLSGLESGATVAALSAKTHHSTVSTSDDLIASALRSDAMIMLSVTNAADLERAKPIVAAAMDKHIDLLAEGKEAFLAQLKPDYGSVWVPGNRLFISTRSDRLGLFLLPFDATATTDEIDAELTRIRHDISTDAASQKRVSRTAARSASPRSASSTGSIELPDLIAPTPSAVCISIRNELVQQLADPDIPEYEVDHAVQRVCQYGTIGEFRTTPAEVGVYGVQPNPSLVLNMRKEWMLLLSEDKTQPNGSRAYLWLRTLGDNAGSGFAWTNGAVGHAYTDKKGVDMYDIMRPAIYSGWGPVETNPAFWPNKNPADMFRCEQDPNAVDDYAHDANSVMTSAYCPVKPRLLSVLPADSYDDNVTVGTSTGWSIGGQFSAGISEKKPEVSLGLSGGYSSSNTTEATLSMVRTSTSADTIMYRKTTWSPGWEALAKWIENKGLKKDSYVNLSSATPLAKSINPAWSAVWELPLEANLGPNGTGRTTLYTSVYDVQTQWCMWDDKSSNCTNQSIIDKAGAWISKSALFVTIQPPPK
jgi:hypothetical protein